MAVFYSGKVAIFQVASATWRLSEYSLDIDGDIVDTTNFSSSGQRENIAGLQKATITGRGPYDTGAMAMTVGTVYTVTLTVGGAITFAIPVRISKLKVSTKVDGVAEVEVTGESTGTFTAAIT